MPHVLIEKKHLLDTLVALVDESQSAGLVPLLFSPQQCNIGRASAVVTRSPNLPLSNTDFVVVTNAGRRAPPARS